MAGNMDDAMAEAVEGAEAVIVCASEKYKASENCKKEFQYAVAKKKLLVPVRLEAVELDGWLGFRLAQTIYYEDVHSDAALEQTVTTIIAKELKPRKIEPRRSVTAPTFALAPISTAPISVVPTASLDPAPTKPKSGTVPQTIAVQRPREQLLPAQAHAGPSTTAKPVSPQETVQSTSADLVPLLQAQLQAQQQSNQLLVQIFQQNQQQIQAHQQQIQAQEQRHQAQEQRHQEQIQAQEQRHQEQMRLLLAVLGRFSPDSVIPVASESGPALSKRSAQKHGDPADDLE
eukprot:TRINITY_DN5445_c0_g1_i1.p1 TRINITY_DN5445_c0_g1~~TRINITY_DN5445_c0_g1_i1.p1  ORF type:complete len:330 (-),score=82.17 TRINITY_DN5445_c0_g1_i1:16-879(-)